MSIDMMRPGAEKLNCASDSNGGREYEIKYAEYWKTLVVA